MDGQQSNQRRRKDSKVWPINMGLINKVDMVCLSPVGYGVS